MPYKPTSSKPTFKNPYIRTSLLSYPRNRGIFAAAVLGFVLIITLSIGINRALNPDHPLTFVSMNAGKLEQTLRTTKKLSSLVIVYDAACEPCKRQLKAIRPLYANVVSGELDLVLVSFDTTPDAAAELLKEYRLPLQVVPYYAAEQDREQIVQTLRAKGVISAKTPPYTSIFTNRGALVAEYPSLVSAQSIRSVFSIFTR